MFNSLPTVITAPGWYLLRNGKAAQIRAIGPDTAHGSIAWRLFRQQIPEFTHTMWLNPGRAYPFEEAGIDIIAPLPDFDPAQRDWYLSPARMQERAWAQKQDAA